MRLHPSEIADLSPIAALNRLELLDVELASGTDLAPLLACTQLVRVRLREPRGDEPVLAELRARGVLVDIVTDLPAPTGGRFADPMLALAVLEELAHLGDIPLPTAWSFDELELDQENLARLAAYPFTEQQLARIEKLRWLAGGMPLQRVVWPEFDGETGEFEMSSLAGIEHLVNLREVIFQTSKLPAVDIEELRARGVKVTIE